MRMRRGETPLHLAVIHDDVGKFHDSFQWDPFLFEKNGWGLTPLDLAKFLGRESFLEQLGWKKFSINRMDPVTKEITVLSKERFLNEFGVVYRPWNYFENYALLKSAIRNCPLLLKWRWSGYENQELGKKYGDLLDAGYTPNLYIRWIDDIFGYGLFANTDIEEGAWIGEYTGVVRRLYRRHLDLNIYCFQYPTRYWSWKYFIIDAMSEGSYLRFANHSDTPTMQPATLVVKGLLHQVFFAKRAITKGTQLTFNYGEDYWIRREKHPILES